MLTSPTRYNLQHEYNWKFLSASLRTIFGCSHCLHTAKGSAPGRYSAHRSIIEDIDVFQYRAVFFRIEQVG